jgi:ABC-type transport system involved in multi-copper enzyme maturation permease subunit
MVAMTDRISSLVGGPILEREFVRINRKPAVLALRIVYCLLALFLFFSIIGDGSDAPSPPHVLQARPGAVLISGIENSPRFHTQYLRFVSDAGKYVSLLLHQQLVLILLLTPLLTAGAIVYEKEGDTLLALFGTDLGPREIVTGKLVGRLAVLAVAAAPAVPVLVFMAVLADLSVTNVCLALAQAAVLAYALGALCLLLSLRSRRSADAIIGCYAAVFVGGLLVVSFHSAVRIPAVLDPVDFLGELTGAGGKIRWWPAAKHLGCWAAIGTLCLAVTALRLNAATLRQPPVERRRWAYRPPMGDRPVRWRERYVMGLAPVAALRSIPAWMGRLGVFVFSAVLVGQGLDEASGGGLRQLFRDGDIRGLLAFPGRHFARADWLWFHIHLMGFVLAAVGGISTSVRCAGSIAEEKRRKTWDDLVLTPLTLEEILQQKYAGVLGAVIVPMVLYTLPMLIPGAILGWPGILAVALWAGGALVVMAGGGWLGIGLAADAAGNTRPENNVEAFRLDRRGRDGRMPPAGIPHGVRPTVWRPADTRFRPGDKRS